MTQRPTNEKQRRRAHRLKQLAQRQAFEASKPKPRFDAAIAMLQKTPLEGALGDPIHNPLWLTLAESEERERVRKQVEAWADCSAPCGWPGNEHYRVTLESGRSYHASEFMELQRRAAYVKLSRGMDPRRVAADVYWTVDEVERFKEEFGFTRTQVL